MTTWHPVTELPTANITALGYVPNHGFVIMSWRPGFRFWVTHQATDLPPTHWTELPKAPK